jgi:predicted enzyme related to lactoylglutathione lyase
LAPLQKTILQKSVGYLQNISQLWETKSIFRRRDPVVDWSLGPMAETKKNLQLTPRLMLWQSPRPCLSAHCVKRWRQGRTSSNGQVFVTPKLKEMKINRMMTNICSERLKESRDFYTDLFDFNVDYDSDWFIHLISKSKQLELGIIDINSELVPDEIRKQPTGTYITFVVDDVDEVFEIAKEKKYEVLQNPDNTFYGQRRMLLKDPNNYVIDISSPI